MNDTTTISIADRKAANIAAHQARNVASKEKALLDRSNKVYEGISRHWLHNAELQNARLEAERVRKGMKPYEMTYRQACVFEGTSREGDDMVAYRVPMSLEALEAWLPEGYTLTSDKFSEDEPPIVSIDFDGNEIGYIEDDLRDELVVTVEYVLIGIEAVEGASDETFAHQTAIRRLNAALMEAGAEVTKLEADNDDEDEVAQAA